MANDIYADWVDNFYNNNTSTEEMFYTLRQAINNGDTVTALDTVRDLEERFNTLGAEK